MFEDLADALNKLPNGFPRTPSGVEIRILKKLFSNEEAIIASQLGRTRETAEAIASRTGLAVEDLKARLHTMAAKELIWEYEEADGSVYRLAPFIVGIYEASDMDHELAHLVEAYLSNGGAEGIMRPQPALHRVVPAQNALKSEAILPYDDVKALLLKSKSFALRNCICREQQKEMGHGCRFPMRTCLSFSENESPPHKSSLSKDEALAFLDESEELGLVHTVRNVMKGIGYVCNCCGCCCGIIRGINDWGIENSVARSNYLARIDPGECSGCGVCVDRCQVHAIREENGISVVDRSKCIGCGLCVTGCPTGAAVIDRKPEEEIVTPPADFETWEQQRLRNRTP